MANVRRRCRQAWGWLLAAGLVFVAQLPSSASAGWGARKPKPEANRPRKPRKPRPARPRRPADRPAASQPAAALPFATRARAALDGRARPRTILPLVKEAVARREIPVALELAERVLDDRRARQAELVDVATALGVGRPFPVQVALWRRAYDQRGGSSWIRDSIEEGYADALLASGDHARAGEVLRVAMQRRRPGMRGPIVARLVAWAKVADAVDEVRDRLLALRDPDAAVAAARLVTELDGEAAGAAVLREAFERFPGHHGLGSAYLAALSRLGDRPALEKAVQRIVRVTGGDPMPWLLVLDAHIVARDNQAARTLIDRLAAAHKRHEVLLEALIDREQRLGDVAERIEPLFEALLRAAPRNPAHVEAYAEWLLVRSHGQLDRALAVLCRLERMPAGPIEGKRRMAQLLAAHGQVVEARGLLLELRDAHPNRRDVLRDLAQLDGASGRKAEAEAVWLQLCAIPPGADEPLRRDVAEARRSLLTLWRAWAPPGRLRGLQDALAAGRATLGEALLLIEGWAGEVAAGATPQLPRAWLAGALATPATGPLAPHIDDLEMLQRVGELLLARRETDLVRGVVERLLARQPEAGRELGLRLVEAALLRQDLETARAVEQLLGEGGLDVHACLRLGELHLRAGDRLGARRLLQRAAALAPRDVRPTARLARLFRDEGDLAEEDAALRAVVVRTVDADELEQAGRRLLTLAMARGSAGALLRWFDTVIPTHPRRAVIERFRLQAYDAWLRTEPLERRLGGDGEPPPSASALGEALAQGDLAMRVRALRQARRLRRPLPEAVARRLLTDPNAMLRRDTIFALAAAGDDTSVAVLLESEGERHFEVRVAQLLALGQLRPLPRVVPFLEQQLRERNVTLASLTLLALGHVGDPSVARTVLDVSDKRRELALPALLALGPVARAIGDADARSRAIARIAALSHPAPTLDHGMAIFARVAGSWSLAASGDPGARALLLDRAIRAETTIERVAALRLLAAEPPRLEGDAFDLPDLQNLRGLHDEVMSRVIAPWMVLDDALVRAALVRLDAELAPLVTTLPTAERARFCGHVAPRAPAGGALVRACR